MIVVYDVDDFGGFGWQGLKCCGQCVVVFVELVLGQCVQFVDQVGVVWVVLGCIGEFCCKFYVFVVYGGDDLQVVVWLQWSD